MNYARNKIIDKKLPSYAGFFILLAALGITLVLSGNALVFISRATVDSEPQNVQISNLSDTSFTISFTTNAPAIGTLIYGTDISTPNIALDDRDQTASGSAQYQVHFITIKNLTPATQYYYVIVSGDQKLENNGQPFSITTESTLTGSTPTQQTLSGSVAQSDGSVPSEGIIYVTTNNSQQLAGLINPDGTYSIPLGGMRDSTGSNAASLTPDTVLQLQAQSPTQSSTVKLLDSEAGNVPKIVLPQNYDFTLGSTPQASTSGGIASGSAFPVQATPAPVSSPEITVPSQNQTFSDQQPLFQGMALPSTEVDITIQSKQEISAKLQSDASGLWQFRPPLSLTPGNHTLTIKSVDATGILQTLSRSFVVYASGSQFIEPSVSPVASASPILVPTATTMPTPTLSPTPTATPSATPTPAPITPAIVTRTPLPKTGSSVLVFGILGTISTISIGALLFLIL